MPKKRAVLDLSSALERASAELENLDAPGKSSGKAEKGLKAPKATARAKLPPEAARQFREMKASLLDFEKAVKADAKKRG